MLRLVTLLLLLFPAFLRAQCLPGERAIRLEVTPDQYWWEVSWRLTDLADATTYATGAATGTGLQVFEYCLPNNGCAVLRLADSYGDGIAPDGLIRLYVDNVLVSEIIGENYGHGKAVTFGCLPGQFCSDPVDVTTGQYSTPNGAEHWYAFVPAQNGTYRVSTCDLGNTCPSKIWVYAQCDAALIHANNLGTLFYADGGCASDPNGASAELYLAGGQTYYLRLGYASGTCNDAPLQWSLEYVGPVVGCTDPDACNYNPLASVSGPCVYPGDPDCNDLPDLIVDEQDLRTSLEPDILINNDPCPVEEGCLRGYGTRHLLRFTTRIDNIGVADYNIGPVPNSPNTPSTQFVWDPCHNHWHYRGYAEYVVFDAAGTRVPLGSKNGFCVLDLSCPPNIPGKFTCGDMGITAGCGDIYDKGLPCQWIDVTGLAAGTYTLAVRVNWDKSPDQTGRPEVTYENNWAQACFALEYAPNGQPLFDFLNDCPVYTDCAGEAYGPAQPDCNGVCNGTALRGDWNGDTLRTSIDVLAYIANALDETGTPTSCNDLFADTTIDVYDAALLQECVLHGDDPTYWGTRFACQFPTGLSNPDDIVYLLPGSLDTVAKTFDIEIVNPYSKLLGFEFEVSGLTVESVETLDTTLDVTWHYDINGKVVGLSASEKPLQKHILPAAFLRFHYSALTSSDVCVASIQALVNEKYERSNALVADPACVNVITSGVADRPAEAFGAFAMPNPAHDRFTVFFPNAAGQPVQFTLTDATGRVLRHFDGVRGESVTVERGDWPAGVYFYRVEGVMGRAVGRVVVK